MGQHIAPPWPCCPLFRQAVKKSGNGAVFHNHAGLRILGQHLCPFVHRLQLVVPSPAKGHWHIARHSSRRGRPGHRTGLAADCRWCFSFLLGSCFVARLKSSRHCIGYLRRASLKVQHGQSFTFCNIALSCSFVEPAQRQNDQICSSERSIQFMWHVHYTCSDVRSSWISFHVEHCRPFRHARTYCWFMPNLRWTGTEISVRQQFAHGEGSDSQTRASI